MIYLVLFPNAKVELKVLILTFPMVPRRHLLCDSFCPVSLVGGEGGVKALLCRASHSGTQASGHLMYTEMHMQSSVYIVGIAVSMVVSVFIFFHLQ